MDLPHSSNHWAKNKYFSSVYEIGLQHTGWWILLLGTTMLLLELLYGILKYLLQLQMSSDKARPGYCSIGRDVEVSWAVLRGALQQNGGELSNHLHVTWTLQCKKKQLFLLQWACVWRQNICNEEEETEGLYWLVRQLTVVDRAASQDEIIFRVCSHRLEVQREKTILFLC